MEIKTYIKEPSRLNKYYSIVAKDKKGKEIHISRVFESYEEAKIAEAVLIYMYSQVLTIGQAVNFDSDEWIFNVRAIFRLLNTPNKW